jgi:hypothetical protein
LTALPMIQEMIQEKRSTLGQRRISIAGDIWVRVNRN